MIEKETAMALTTHLRELRKRLIVCVIATAIGFALCYNYSVELYGLLTKPLIPALPPGDAHMVFTGVVEPFFIYMKVGLFGGLILASPVILFEIWGFVAPGLYKGERAWPSIWLVARKGLCRATASVLAKVAPTTSAVVRPGPTVAAMASISAHFSPACWRVCWLRWGRRSRWAREASSGTTPP
ncbi:MAG: hypothetical protein A2X93_08810 [Deltaproteobacteria bacterium GWC2_56_8]|nr:MAG: hypothetical protein A2X93_08810 [Deltaproteobacteria bacterium GWC2_56_8]